MSKKFDHEQAAKADIVARPDVSERPEQAPDIAPEAPEKPEIEQSAEPDELEKAAGRLISKTLDRFKTDAGMAADKDFSTLTTEIVTGVFSGLRFMSNRPWLRYVMAGGALMFSAVPAFLAYSKAKAEEEENEK